MEALKQRILKEGVALGSDRINVDGFINHKIDTEFMDKIGAEFGRKFAGVQVDKILTVEASGIAIAVAPVVFAKKAAPNTMTDDCYTAEAFSFTKQKSNMLRVSKKHLENGEKVLIIDDFLAHGEASLALCKIIEEAGAEVAGVGIVISKDFQGGKALLEDQGYRVETLVSVSRLENGEITFA